MYQEIDSFDRDKRGMTDTRLAQDGDNWFVFHFSLNTAQATPVESGAPYDFSKYSKSSGAGVRNIANPKTESEARQLFNKLRVNLEYK